MSLVLGGLGVRGGVKFYRGAAAAARAYVEADHSRADDYYLVDGAGLATRYTASPGSPSGCVVRAGELDGETYERWVAGYDVATGRAKGRLREDTNGLRFVEVVVNGPKTWSLAAALHPEVSAALDAAQDRAAEQIIGWLAAHATTRVGPRGRQVQVPVESMEAAVIRHYTSRAGDPHRHLHLQINARVFADGKWRGLHSVGVRDMVAAINGIGHAAVATDPEFRATLAAHGFTMDPATGELAELTPYVGRFSARTAQIGRNIARYEAQWRAEHPGKEPGPRLRQGWDRRAWAEARPHKPHPAAPDAPDAPVAPAGPAGQGGVVPVPISVEGAAMVAAWNQVLHQLGYRDHGQVARPLTPHGPSVGSLDRDRAAELVVSRLGAARSAWNTADIRGGVEEWIAATGLVAEAGIRIEVAEDITARAASLCVPLLDQPGVPEHVRSLTSARVLAVEADLVTAMVDRAAGASALAPSGPEVSGLDEGQREAVAALAGTGRLVVVEGAAGAGKTTMLAAVQQQLGARGHQMVVVTPTLKAAQVAATAATQARSAAALIHEYGWRWDEDGRWSHESGLEPQTVLGKGDLLLVDEAGMLDQDTARALFGVAEQTGARVGLIGDRHQLPAVGRGGVLDLAARWAAPEASVGLDVVHRFLDPAYAAISLAMRRGDRLVEPVMEHAVERGDGSGQRSGEPGGEVFDALWARGQIRLYATETERIHAVAAELSDLFTTGNPGAGRVVVMADSRAEVAALNGAIRDRLVTAGRVRDAQVVVTDAGERIGVGDRVATRLNDRELGVANRDLWTVTAVAADGSLTLIPADISADIPADARRPTNHRHDRGRGRGRGRGQERGQDRVVPAGYARQQVELAYATTVYGAQGETTAAGHMLIAETTTGSAAYVGMTRGRETNIAHLVATDIDGARAIWNDVMGRDRADLGPGHAAERAAEEMERYAPQRPRHVVLNRLRAAWTEQADLTEARDRLTGRLAQIEAVLAIRTENAPRHQELRTAERNAVERWGTAIDALKALEIAIAAEQLDIAAELWRQWRAEQPEVYRALATVRDGAGPLGLHRGRVRDAHDTLTEWAARWQPLLPELDQLATDPAHDPAHASARLAGIDQGRVREAIAAATADRVAAAHPEAAAVRAAATAAERAAHDAKTALEEFGRDLVEKLRPYRWVAYASNLPDLRDQASSDLDAVCRNLDATQRRVQALLRAPEIRSLPDGQLRVEHDTWASDREVARQAARQAAREAARVKARQQAAAEREALAKSQREITHGPSRGPSRDHRGPGVSF